MPLRRLPQPYVLDPSQGAQNFIASMQAKHGEERKKKQEERESEQDLMKKREEIGKFTQEQLLSLDPEDPEFDKKKMEVADEVGNYAHSLGIPAPEITEGAKRFITGYNKESAKQFRIKAGLATEEEKGKDFTLGPGQKRYDAEGNVIAEGPEKEQKPMSAIGKIKADLGSGTITQDEANAAIQKVLSKKGTKITVDKDGNIQILEGDLSEMTPKTTGAVEEKLLGNLEQYNRMKTIVSDFKPEYQEVGNRLSQAWTGIKAKMGQDVPPEDAKKLTKFKGYQRKAIENINLYIKEITGAQMSEKEANRLRLAQPDPGENWWQGDDPITFKAKADDILKYSRAAAARYQYYLNKGMSTSEIKRIINSDEAISLDDLVSRMQ